MANTCKPALTCCRSSRSGHLDSGQLQGNPDWPHAAWQKAEVTFDAYSDTPIEARVDSLFAASGAQFSLLPPDKCHRQLHQGRPADSGKTDLCR